MQLTLLQITQLCATSGPAELSARNAHSECLCVKRFRRACSKIYEVPPGAVVLPATHGPWPSSRPSVRILVYCGCLLTSHEDVLCFSYILSHSAAGVVSA